MNARELYQAFPWNALAHEHFSTDQTSLWDEIDKRTSRRDVWWVVVEHKNINLRSIGTFGDVRVLPK